MPSRSMAAPTDKGRDFATASVPDTLAALGVNPEAGLSHEEAQVRLKENGHNEVTEQRGTLSSNSSENSGACRHGCSN